MAKPDFKNKLNPNGILTTGQIAEYCQVDARTVNRWLREGVLQSYALPITGFKRVKVSDFLQFLKNYKMPLPINFAGTAQTRILIVDDDMAVINSIKRLLAYQQIEPFVCETATNGFEAGQMLQKTKPNLVILDIRMPLVDGFQVCQLIKSNPDMQSVKVLAISGSVDNGDRKKILAVGADEFLAKPFTEEAFKVSVSRLLSEEKVHENTKSN